MKEWICREMSTSTIPNENGILMIEKELIRCKDCKHRPKRTGDDDQEGYNLEFPDRVCPCQCDDPWYNWMPRDGWYCGYGERKEE